MKLNDWILFCALFGINANLSAEPAPEFSVVVPTETKSEVAQQLLPITPAPVAVEPQAKVATSSLNAEPDSGLVDCSELTQRSQLQLDKLQANVTEVNKRLQKLRKELDASEQKRRQQAVLIDFFEQQLQSQRKYDLERSELVKAIFNGLSTQLPESPVFRVEDNRLIIMTDFTLAFGYGAVSTEGETRLQLIANALQRLGSTMPTDVNWRWRIEGHSDSQPLRSRSRFRSNWELSAARAFSIAHYLIDQGIPAERMRVAALGSTQPIEPNAEIKDEHWRNRRVEIHLSLERS